MMSKTVNMLQKLLRTLELSADESLVVGSMYDGHTKATDIAKDTKLSRSKVYRIFEKLLDRGVITQEERDYGSQFFPPKLADLENFVKEQKRSIDEMETAVDELKIHIESLHEKNTPKSKVLHYYGELGYKQVNWNSTKAKKELRIYEFETLTDLTDERFAEDVRMELVKNSIKILQLTNHKRFEDYTNVIDLMKLWEVRYIDPQILDITSETMIYNDTFTSYENKGNDVLIIEVENPQLAKMQKQMFDNAWNIAKPLTITSPNGAAVLQED